MRYSLFNSLVQKYESYLKKLYYLINDDEVEGQDGRDAMLADAIHAFRCLWKLKYATDEDGKKFSSYLQMLRDWRNNEAHNAPVSSLIPPSTSICVSRPSSFNHVRSVRIRSSASGINFWPPKPGSTLIIKNKSKSCKNGFNTSIGV